MMLGAAGFDTTLFEAAPTIGGRTARLTLTANDGHQHHFDRGPTFFLMPYVLEEIFAAAGRRLIDYAPLQRLDPMYRLVIERQGATPITLDCTQDRDAMAARLAAVEPADAAGFDRFMHLNRAKLAAFTPVLRRGFKSALDLLSLDVLKAAPKLAPHQSVATYLKGLFKNPALRLALSFQSKYLGMSPYSCPSLFSILPFIEYEYGIWHPKGGCNALMSAMAVVAAEHGVTIRCGTPVERVVVEGRRAVGLTLRGDPTPRRFDHVVLNADASHALKALVPEAARNAARSYTDKRLDAMRYSCSTFMLYLGLTETLDLPHHTIRIAPRYEDNLRDIESGRATDDPSIYIHNPSPLDPSLSPPLSPASSSSRRSSLYILIPTPNLKSSAGQLDWQTLAPRYRERALDLVARLAGRDPRPLIACEHAVTPNDWCAANINFGATFNLAHNLGQMLHLRPQHEVQGFERLWLVGGGTHPGSGLPVIFLSAQITSRLIAAREGLADPTTPRPTSPPSPPAPSARLAPSDTLLEPHALPHALSPAPASPLLPPLTPVHAAP
jgi:phytoene desaturase